MKKLNNKRKNIKKINNNKNNKINKIVILMLKSFK